MVAALRLATAGLALTAVSVNARFAEHVAPRGECSLFPVSTKPERALYDVRTSFSYVRPDGTDLPLQMLGPGMSALFGDCAIIAVAQSIPLEPMEFARLYETTLAQQADNNGDTLLKPSKTPDTRPVCDALVRDASTDKGVRARVLDAVIGPEGPLIAESASANETAALVDSLRESGKRRTAITALAGRPVRYAVCSADTWDNSLVLDAQAGHGENAGGRQLTYIAFLNTCPDYDARITLEIVPAGQAADPYCEELRSLNSGLVRTRVAVLLSAACATVLFWILVLFCTCCCTCWCCCANEGRSACACSRGTRACWDRSCTRIGFGWVLRGAPVHINAAGVSRLLLLSALCIPAFLMYQQLHVPWFERDDLIDPTHRTSIRTWAIASNNRAPALKLLDSLQRGVSISMPGFAATWLYFSHPRRDAHFCSKAALAAFALFIATLNNAAMLLDLLSYYGAWRRKGFHAIIVLAIIASNTIAWAALAMAWCHKKLLTHTEAVVLDERAVSPPTPLAHVASGPDGEPLGASAEADFTPQLSVARRWQLAAKAARVAAAPQRQQLDLANLTAQVQSEHADSRASAAVGSAAAAAVPVDEKLAGSDDRWRRRWPRRFKALCTGKVATLPKQAWDAVCEEPGFRYSPYFTSALVIAFVILTASLATALAAVEELARCTEPDSQCLRNVQRWIFENLVAGFVGAVSVEAAESLALGCDAAGIGTANGTAAVQRTLSPLPAQCAAAYEARSLTSNDTPRWVLDGRDPVLVGGRLGFAVAYVLGVYTILHIAVAYKRFVKAVAAAPSVQHLPRFKPYGTDPLQDFSSATLGQSSYFAGMLVSTCWVQLWWAGVTLGLVFGALLHPEFWRLVARHIAWPISVVAIILWHVMSQLALTRWVTPGTRIARPLLWFYLFSLLSTVYFTVGFLLALWRLLQLYFTTMVAMSRLERSLFTIFARADRGYASFLAMVAMVRVLDLQAELDSQGNASAAVFASREAAAAGSSAHAAARLSSDAPTGSGTAAVGSMPTPSWHPADEPAESAGSLRVGSALNDSASAAAANPTLGTTADAPAAPL